MSGPWEDYATTETGPWADYAPTADPPGVKYANVSFGSKKPVDTRKITYTDSGYRPNKKAESVKELAKNFVQDVVEAPLFPIRALKDVADSPNTGKTLVELGKGLVTTPAGFVPGLSNIATGRDASENWMTNPGVGAMMAYPAAKLAKPVAGKTLSTLRDINKPRELPVNANEALSRQFNVPLTAGEVKGSVALKNTETMLERVPVIGTRKFREKQSQSLSDAANKMVNDFEPGSMVSDLPDAIQESMLTTLKKGKDAAKVAYDRIDNIIANEKVTDAITPENVRQVATDLLNEYPDLFDRLPSGPVKSKLASIVEATAPKETQVRVPTPESQGTITTGHHGSKPQTAAILDAQGNPITRTVAPTLSFKDAKAFREQLNNYINRAYKSAGAVGDKELRRLSELKNALDTDIQAWGESSGNAKVVQAFTDANKVYQEQVAPFKDFVVKKATGREFDTDLMIKTFIKSDRPQLGAKLMNTLDDNGKALVKYAVLKDALDAGTPTTQGVPFSPAKFAGKLERLGNTKNAIFTAEERTMIDGFTKLARITEQAGRFAENPPTGLRATDAGISFGAGAAAISEPVAFASSAAAIKTLSFLLTSEAGKKLLVRAAKTPGKSKAWGEIIRQFAVIVPAKLEEQYGKIKDTLKKQ